MKTTNEVFERFPAIKESFNLNPTVRVCVTGYLQDESITSDQMLNLLIKSLLKQNAEAMDQLRKAIGNNTPNYVTQIGKDLKKESAKDLLEMDFIKAATTEKEREQIMGNIENGVDVTIIITDGKLKNIKNTSGKVIGEGGTLHWEVYKTVDNNVNYY